MEQRTHTFASSYGGVQLKPYSADVNTLNGAKVFICIFSSYILGRATTACGLGFARASGMCVCVSFFFPFIRGQFEYALVQFQHSKHNTITRIIIIFKTKCSSRSSFFLPLLRSHVSFFWSVAGRTASVCCLFSLLCTYYDVCYD